MVETREKKKGMSLFVPLAKGVDKLQEKLGWKDVVSNYRKYASVRNAFREQNPIAPGLADIVQWVQYDRFTAAQATTLANQFTFFSLPQGSGGKTKADTNMEQVMRLPDPLWMNVVGIGFHFAPNMFLPDITGFINTYFMEFWVGNKVYVEGPVNCFPSAGGITGSTTQNNQAVWTNGQARPDAMFDLRLPAGLQLGQDNAGNDILTDGLTGITILQGQQFKVVLTAPAGGLALTATAANANATGFNMMVYLYGILSRGVQ